MAIGLGEMFGIKLPVNFNSPYKALTITEKNGLIVAVKLVDEDKETILYWVKIVYGEGFTTVLGFIIQ